MVALSARRFVCSAIEVITLTTLPISVLESPSFDTLWFVVSATPTASEATRAASLAFCAISRIEAPISCEPAASVCTLCDTVPASPATTFARDAAAWALSPMRDVTPVSRCVLSPRVRAAVASVSTVRPIPSFAWFTATAMAPSSSRDSTAARLVRSPSAALRSVSETVRSWRFMRRPMSPTTNSAIARPAIREPIVHVRDVR
jgi:hypothetical protein